ncbi:MAG: YggS family pyridoxal phosphate-dependent enzyme [Deltaproteobacteria bacterium]|jgi:pyridoxal phosphate enzyme (YggS family)|nr:YggS family pyridoxal phosphate-dependent enzyme [Deltaproteobacteria bacterium]
MSPLELDPALAQSRWERIQDKIRQAAQTAGRDPAEITLLAVSKTFSSQDIRVFWDLGQKDFGENYLQEAQEKIGLLPEPNWHFIGHLQTNKARFVPGLFSCLHTLESLELAEKLDRHLRARNLTLKVFIQVNLAREASKSGLPPEDLAPFLEKLAAFPSLSPQGLMTLPPFSPDPEKSRPYFRSLYELREKQAPRLKELSMGMSGDFTVAISEGATIVRIGTALFGDRDYS